MSSCGCQTSGWSNSLNLGDYVAGKGLQKIATEAYLGATSTKDGAMGLVPEPVAGQESYFLQGDGKWAEIPAFDPFSGATAGADGSSGAVPQSLAGQQDLVLHGDGTWRTPTNYRGATAGAAGTAGSVPPASAGQQDLFLRGDGTWGAASSGSSSSLGGAKVNFDPSDWAQIGADFVIVLTAGIHGLSDPTVVQVIETASGDVVALDINKSGTDITLTAPLAFAGEVTLIDTSTLTTVNI